MATSKYEPLGKFLEHLEADEWRPTLLELERILGFELPGTAKKQKRWWSEGGGSHAKVWTDAGWAAEAPDLEKESVHFRRLEPRHYAPPAAEQAQPAATNRAGAPQGQDHTRERKETLKKVAVGGGIAAAVAAVAAVVFRVFRKRA